MVVRLAQTFTAHEEVGSVKVAEVRVSDRGLVEEEVFGPLNQNPFAGDVPVIVVGRNLARVAAINIETAVLKLYAMDRLQVEIETANVKRPSAGRLSPRQ